MFGEVKVLVDAQRQHAGPGNDTSVLQTPFVLFFSVFSRVRCHVLPIKAGAAVRLESPEALLIQHNCTHVAFLLCGLRLYA